MNRFPNYEFHELANCWPLATSEEHQELVESIKKHGQKEKITLHDGKILDGRNRYNACKEVGVKPEFETLKPGEDASSFVIAKNTARRHLSPSQRAMVGVKLKQYFEQEAEARKLASLKQNSGDATVSANLRSRSGKASEKAGRAVGVSSRSIEMAESVVQKGVPQLTDAVMKGEVAVSVAADLVEAIPSKEEQQKVVDRGAGAIKAAVSEKRQARMEFKKDGTSEVRPQPIAAPLVQIQALLAKVDILDVAELLLEKLDGNEEFEKMLREKCPLTVSTLARPNEGESDVTLHDNDSRTPSESASPGTSDDPELESQRLFDRFDASGRAVVYATISDLWRVESGGKPKRSNVFIKPTLEQVTQYCAERKNSVDPEKFYDYYQTQGWKLANGNSMKDWQSAIRTWEKSAGTKTVQTPARPAGIPLVGILPPAEEQPIRPRKDLMDQFKKLKPFEPVES